MPLGLEPPPASPDPRFSPPATPTPPSPQPPPAPARPGGPPGWLLGLLAVLVIGGIAAMLAWPLVIQPRISDVASERLTHAVKTEVERADPPAELASGQVSFTEEEFNDYLADNADRFDPIEAPRVEIDPDGLRLSFSLYRLDGTITGMVGVADGRIVVTEVDTDGPAGQFLTADDAVSLIETQLNAYLANAGVRPTALNLGDGALTIETKPAP